MVVNTHSKKSLPSQPLCSEVAHKAAVKMPTRSGVSPEGSTGEGSASKLICPSLDRIPLVKDYWAKGLTSSLWAADHQPLLALWLFFH